MREEPWLIDDMPRPFQDYDYLGQKLREVVIKAINTVPVASRSKLYANANMYRKKIMNKLTKKPLRYC